MPITWRAASGNFSDTLYRTGHACPRLVGDLKNKKIGHPATRTFSLKRALSLFLLVTASNVVMADQFYLTVEILCNAKKQKLDILFNSDWNEAGEKTVAQAGIQIIDPRSLISFTKDSNGDYLSSKKEVSRKCPIGGKDYEVVVRPLTAPRFHPEGYCAARIGATVFIKERRKVVVSEAVDACTESGEVVSRISLSGGKSIHIKRIPASVFYADRRD